jgi:hypothetical protein
MAYTIISERLDCGKAVGDLITEEELLAMGANSQALIAGGHISDASKSKSAPSAPEGEING